VAQPAAATPNPATGTTANLSVLGADDAGEASLLYEWSILSKPSGAADPTFSVNGTNAAKNTVAAFAMAGNYTFRVTIRDAGGLATTSDVSVSVKQTLTSITVTPAEARVRIRSRTRFWAAALDQFGDVLLAQPVFTWRLQGQGAINANGRYTAPDNPGGPYTIIAKVGTVRGYATVIVVRRL